MSNKLYNDKIIVNTSDTHKIIALSKKNGAKLWEIRANLNIYGDLVVKDSIGFVGVSDGKLLKINLEKGEIIDEFQTQESKINYSDFFDSKNNLKAQELISKYSGNYEKIYESFENLDGIYSSSVIEGNSLYFCTVNGKIFALEI